MLGVVALFGFWQVSAFGQTVVWGGGTGNWSNASNWSCLCVPNGGGFSVNIGTGTGAGPITGTVTLDIPASVAGVSLGNGAFGELDVSLGNTLTTSNAVIVGASDVGTLNINTGGVVNDVNGAMGSLSVATGNATVSGSGSVWNNSNDLSVGLNGSGTVTIDGGGHVTGLNGFIGANSGSTGSVTVSGSGSQWNNSNDLTVGLNGSGTLTISGRGSVTDPSAGLGVSSGSTGNATISGSGSRWNNSGLHIGEFGQATLSVENGGMLASDGAILGDVAGSLGNVTVSGKGSQWNDAGTIVVGGGNGGRGTLTAQNGGAVNSQGGWIGTGTVTVRGTGSEWNQKNTLQVGAGANANGILNIQKGGLVNSSGGGFIGTFAGSGTVTVSGTGSQLTSSTLCVGCFGTGMVTIDSGAMVLTTGDARVGVGSVVVTGKGSQWHAFRILVNQGTVTIGSGATVDSPLVGIANGGSALVSGSGSQWNISTVLDLGDVGQGKLTIQNGGVVNSAGINSAIGAGPGAGVVTVTGAGSQWNNTLLLVGPIGNGSLMITNGGVVNDTSGGVGSLPQGLGRVLVAGSGSTWNNATTLDIGTKGMGTLTVTHGGLVAAGTLANPGTITIGTHGTVHAKGGTLQGNVVNHGTLDPLGTANIVGNYTQNSDGTLALDVVGTGPGQFGQLDVSGNALFDGTIMFDFIDGFAPQQGQSFDFINVMGTGDFSGATIDISGLRPGFKFADGFSSGAFTLTALNNGVSENTVPEPGTLLLLAAGLVGVALCVRKRRRLAATL